MPRDRIVKLKHILRVNFSEKAQVLVDGVIDSFPLDKNILTPTTQILDLDNFDKEYNSYVIKIKKKVLELTDRRDPITMILAEKVGDVVFKLNYLEGKYPRSITLAGTTPAANKFVGELEYVKALLINQLTYLFSCLTIGEDKFDVLLSYQDIKSEQRKASRKTKSSEQDNKESHPNEEESCEEEPSPQGE